MADDSLWIKKPKQEMVTIAKSYLQYLEKSVVSGFYEDAEPYFRQGVPVHDLEDEVTAAQVTSMYKQHKELKELINTPEIHSFRDGVVLEAIHQRTRWDSDHDAGKTPEDWFWLIGYLGGKALAAHREGDTDKARHRIIATAAALGNWHAAITGDHVDMRPGIMTPKGF